MSAALAVPVVIPLALAVAQPETPAQPGVLLDGAAFHRKHALTVLNRYLQTSMLVGRAPSLLGNVVFRGRVSSRQLPSFEGAMIFLCDVEKCLKQLDPFSQAVVAHIALEDYTPPETALLTGESRRTIHRVYGAALDRLGALFVEYGIFEASVENLSSPLEPKPKSQDNKANDLQAKKVLEIWH